MYPDFQYLFQSLFGTEMPAWLSIFKTFGFFVALGFIGAAMATISELKRKEQQGLLLPEFETTEVGKPATVNELVISALIGLLVGYKIGGMFGNWTDIGPDPMGYIFSVKGSLLLGIVGALLFGYIKYYEKKKQALPEPKMKTVAVYPHQRMSELVFIALIGGLVGAKVFNAFETWDYFLQHPVESLVSSSGLTFYGGLIVATAIFYFYARKHKIPFRHLCDAVAPGLMLAYGVGRFGCHFAGDGDWGIFNSAYVTLPDGSLVASGPKGFHDAIHNYTNYFRSLPNLQYKAVLAPSWLPRWMFAMNYPHNVNNDGIPLPNCAGHYCSVLPVGVFPTPLYEAVTCIILFAILWSLRNRLKYPLHMFGLYLIFNGIERFLVETIRVNYKYNWGFIRPTQAEIISTLLVIAGVCIMLFYKKKEEKTGVEA
ncbi:MAG: prolipoprotein diacylglyceryl transferase [Flavipsychrobacter sp.]